MQICFMTLPYSELFPKPLSRSITNTQILSLHETEKHWDLEFFLDHWMLAQTAPHRKCLYLRIIPRTPEAKELHARNKVFTQQTASIQLNPAECPSRGLTTRAGVFPGRNTWFLLCLMSV